MRLFSAKPLLIFVLATGIGIALLSQYSALNKQQEFRAAGSSSGVITQEYTPKYFVDCQIGSDQNTGNSASSAWKGLDPVRNTQFTPGDVIAFKRGCTWDTGIQNGSVSTNRGLVIDNNGTETAPIVFTAYGEGSLPTFINTYSQNIYVRGIEIAARWVVLDSLAVRDIKEYAILLSELSNNSSVQRSEISNSGDGIVIRGQNNKILENNIHDLKMIVNTNDGGDNDYGATALILVGSNNEIAYNTIKNAIAPSYDYGVDGGALDFFGYDAFTTISGNNIHHNWVQDSDGFFEIGSTNGALISNNSFYSNVLVNNGAVMTIHLAGPWNTRVENLQFNNNTVYENTSEWTLSGQRGNWRLIRFGETAPSNATLSMKNNIWSVSGVPQLSTHDGFAHTHNLYWLTNGTQLGLSLGQGEVQANPLFISPSAKNFQLSAGSQAINVGLNLGYTFDFNGTAIPQGGAPDLGAYEFGVTSSPSPTPTPSATPSPMPTATPAPAPNVAPIITTGKIPTPSFGKSYSQVFEAKDSNLGQILVMSAQLPNGLSLNNCTQTRTASNETIRCTASGTPTTKGSQQIQVTVTDNAGGIAVKTWTVRIR